MPLSVVSEWKVTDLRPLLFNGLPNFDGLESVQSDLWPIWRITKGNEQAWWVGALSAAAAFAERHNLLEIYRRKLGAIPLSQFSVAKSEVEHRSSTSPVWEIVNELIVGRAIEKGLGWTFQSHEPAGRGRRKGDWLFLTPSGRTVFVEVKSFAEREIITSSVYSRPSYAPKVRRVLHDAYRQLPDDGRATLIVLVGRELTSISFGIMHGDLFQALYGQMQIRFNVMPYDPTSMRVVPSFREMFVHGTKHRRLGWVAGLVLTGADYPALKFYAIQNPFAQESVATPESDYANIDRFVVDEAGNGRVAAKANTRTFWDVIAPSNGV